MISKSMNYIAIKAPRWKERTIGIATYRVGQDNKIDILATSPKDGKRYYPNMLYASGDTIKSCPTQTLPSGVVLYLVPISKLEVIEE